MAVDRTAVGNVAAELMGQLEHKYGDREDASVRAVFLIVAVDHWEEDGQHAEVSWGVSENLHHYEALGLLEHVKANL